MPGWIVLLKLAATVLTGISGLLSFVTKTKTTTDGNEHLTPWGKVLLTLLLLGAPVAVVTQYWELSEQAAKEQRTVIPLTDFTVRVVLRIPIDQPAVRPFAKRLRRRFEEIREKQETMGVREPKAPDGLLLAPEYIFPSRADDERALNEFLLNDVQAFVTLASPKAAHGKGVVQGFSDMDLDFTAVSPLKRYTEDSKKEPRKKDELANRLELPDYFEDGKEIYYTLLPSVPSIRRNSGALKGISDLAGGVITVNIQQYPVKVNVEVSAVGLLFKSGQELWVDRAEQQASGFAIFRVLMDILRRTREFRKLR